MVGIERHRLATDGEGVTTLVAFHGCPLRCRYCLNPQTLVEPGKWRRYRCRDLYEKVRVDELYFLATGGGVTFGGGEPLLHPGFIEGFRACCGGRWRLAVETSLQVPRETVERMLGVVDEVIPEPENPENLTTRLRLVDAALTKHLDAALRLKDPARHRQEKFAAMGRAWVQGGNP